jgi:hypothetical protein
MKTAGRENPNRCVAISSGRAHGAAGQNRLCSFTWAAKQEKFQPLGRFFLLTSTFIELIRQVELNRYYNTSAFRWTNIETGKHWSLGAFGQGPVGLPFSHFSETSGEAIHLKGDRKPFASTLKGEKR